MWMGRSWPADVRRQRRRPPRRPEPCAVRRVRTVHALPSAIWLVRVQERLAVPHDEAEAPAGADSDVFGFHSESCALAGRAPGVHHVTISQSSQRMSVWEASQPVSTLLSAVFMRMEPSASISPPLASANCLR